MHQTNIDVDNPAPSEVTNQEKNPFLSHSAPRADDTKKKKLLTCHPKDWLSALRPNPNFPLFVKGDIDGFIVLFTSNLATLLAIILSALPILGSSIVYGRMVPG